MAGRTSRTTFSPAQVKSQRRDGLRGPHNNLAPPHAAGVRRSGRAEFSTPGQLGGGRRRPGQSTLHRRLRPGDAGRRGLRLRRAALVRRRQPGDKPFRRGIPAAPTGLAAASFNSSQITLTWRNNAAAVTSVAFQRCTDDRVHDDVALPAGTTSYTDAPPGFGAYYYRVCAANGSYSSAYSNTLPINNGPLAYNSGEIQAQYPAATHAARRSATAC